MKFKEHIYNACLRLVDERIGLLDAALKDLRESAANETKSSAGDKYETARTMLQIEQDNTRQQLNEAIAKKEQLELIDISKISQKAGRGCLIKTDKGYFFISIALGKVIVDKTPVIVLSAQSPLGSRFTGSVINDRVELNGTIYYIESIE